MLLPKSRANFCTFVQMERVSALSILNILLISLGNGEIPYRRYSPRTRKCRTGVIPVTDSRVWMRKDNFMLYL